MEEEPVTEGAMDQVDPQLDPALWAARVGSRVVVRHRLPGGGLTDSVGELLTAGSGSLRLLTRTGEAVVPLADVVMSKVVPPRATRKAPPHRALSIPDLQRVMSSHWRAGEQEAFGGWVLRAHEGFTDRADSVLTAGGEPPVPLEEALTHVRAWYGARNLPPQLAVAGPVPAGIELPPPPVPGSDSLITEGLAGAGLARAGWAPRVRAGALVLTAPTALVARARPVSPLPPGTRLELADEPDAAWLEVYHYLNVPVPPAGRRLLLDVPGRVFASVRDDDGRALAVARGSMAEGWGAISAVETRSEARRQGLARALLSALGGWFGQRHAAAVLLQTAIWNAPVQRMYLDLGFEVHHRSDYWTPEG